MTELNFDSTVIEPATGRFELLPIDDFLAVISDSSMEPNKKTKGRHLSLTWTVIEGDYKDRKVFSNLNLDNENAQTVEIAQRELSAICRATGILHPKDSSELHDKPVVISVGIRKGSNGYEDSNIIKKFSRVDGKELGDVTDSTPAAKTAAPTGTAKLKPWQRK
jgi:hypothetical protein